MYNWFWKIIDFQGGLEEVVSQVHKVGIGRASREDKVLQERERESDSFGANANQMVQFLVNTRGGTRTHNLLLRREAPYPLGHTSMECISNLLFIVGLSGLWYIEVFNVSSMQMAVFSVGLAKILSYCDNTG